MEGIRLWEDLWKHKHKNLWDSCPLVSKAFKAEARVHIRSCAEPYAISHTCTHTRTLAVHQ